VRRSGRHAARPVAAAGAHGAYTIADDGVLQRRAMPSSQELRPQERDDAALAKRCDAD